MKTACILRRRWRCFIWTVTQPSLGKWVTGLYVTQTGVSPRRVMGPVRHEVPSEASDWSGSEVAWAQPLSLAPGWLQPHKAQCVRNRGVHTVAITSSTRQWCSALGLTLLTLTWAHLLSGWVCKNNTFQLSMAGLNRLQSLPSLNYYLGKFFLI